MDMTPSNADAISGAYASIVRWEYNWLLLHYEDENFDDLALFSFGAEGLEEMKNKIYDLDRVFVAFYREELDVNPGYILINYIPLCVSGVRRARALVHSRRAGAILKNHQTMLTVDNLSQLTTSIIHKALVDPESFSPPPMGHSFSQSSESGTSKSPQSRKPKPITLDMARRSFSETYAPRVRVPQITPPVPPVPPVAKSSGMFASFLRRKKGLEENPPPTPPKDSKVAYPPFAAQQQELPPLPPSNAREHSPNPSLSEFAVISHSHSEDEIVISPTTVPRPPPSSLPTQGKWARTPPISTDPKERERRRKAAQQQREREEQRALEEEQQRQEEIRRRKIEMREQEEEEEARRRADMQEQLRRITAEKERKRRLEQGEEERKKRELEERKQAEREKRLEEHIRLEQWRKKQERDREEEARRAEYEREREEEEHRRKIQLAEKMIAQGQLQESILAGWVTVQFHDSLFWKRRYYKFIGDVLHLCRSPKDTQNPLEVVQLRGQLKGLKEWTDGYEELEAIPFSFVLEFFDERRSWSLFADSEDDKYRILGLLHHAAGL